MNDPALYNVGQHAQAEADVIITTAGRVVKSRFLEGRHVGLVMVVPEVTEDLRERIPPVALPAG